MLNGNTFKGGKYLQKEFFFFSSLRSSFKVKNQFAYLRITIFPLSDVFI